jgi:hypothetical protein
LENFGRFTFLDGRVAGEVADSVGDLRARGSDEEVVHRSCSALLTRRQRRHRALEMLLDDSFRTTELA